MSDIISIDQLRKQFSEKTSLEEWKTFSEMQNSLIEKYQSEIALLRQKNSQLEHLINQKAPQLVSELTPEEIICLQQIRRLENSSTSRELTLEEVKRLDLLVKNLKLIREESTIVVNNRSDNLKESELVAIIQSAESTNTNS
jgi:hypothetical protein